jgi:hypothetical protein
MALTMPPASFSADLRPVQSTVHPWLRRQLTVQPAAAKSLGSSERQKEVHKKAPEGAILAHFLMLRLNGTSRTI